MAPRREKNGAGEGESLASAQAQAHVPAYAQHTNAHAQTALPIVFRVHAPNGRIYTKGARYYSHKQIRSYVSKMHAKGYVCACLWVTGHDVDGKFVPTLSVSLDDTRWVGAPVGFRCQTTSTNYLRITRGARE